jgi:hypothetical protein
MRVLDTFEQTNETLINPWASGGWPRILRAPYYIYSPLYVLVPQRSAHHAFHFLLRPTGPAQLVDQDLPFKCGTEAAATNIYYLPPSPPIYIYIYTTEHACQATEPCLRSHVEQQA